MGLRCNIPDTTGADRSGTCIKNCTRKEGDACGGIAGLQCCDANSPQLLKCLITETYPDAMGKCVSTCRKEGDPCGGFAGLRCCDTNSPQLLKCRITAKYPDALGKCVKAQ